MENEESVNVGGSLFQRMLEAKGRNGATNARVIKPFKSQNGTKELFYHNELVSVAETEIPKVGDTVETRLFIVTGMAYEAGKNSFTIKSAVLTEDMLEKYVKLTGEIVKLGRGEPKKYVTTYLARRDFKDLVGNEIPVASLVTKIVTMDGGLLEDSYEANGIKLFLNPEKVNMFLNQIGSEIEVIGEQNEDVTSSRP